MDLMDLTKTLFQYDTPADLSVHYHADHIAFRHGRDMKCPQKNCDKIYPNRESLRAHIVAHYFGGGATPTMTGMYCD